MTYVVEGVRLFRAPGGHWLQRSRRRWGPRLPPAPPDSHLGLAVTQRPYPAGDTFSFFTLMYGFGAVQGEKERKEKQTSDARSGAGLCPSPEL